MEELSHGVKYQMASQQKRVWLAPSYWSTPLVFINNPRQQETLMVFGCRPDEQNLVPGEYVPDTLVGTLKAMADATRLRILHYLKEAPATPSSLARLLRLRAPTVVHHLSILRLAGLVHILISEEGERRYALRKEALQAAMQQLMVFLEASEAETTDLVGLFSDE
jgi:DNA-binding transcriptional ArsR family regulator